MTDTRVNPNLFGSAAERRAFRDELGTGIGRFIPPELRPLMGFVAEATPSAAVERAGAASMRAVQPGRTGMERLGDVGEVLSETAGVVAPAMVAGRAAMPAAEAAQEAFMGVSVPARAAAETAFERLNQPGPMPETLYSGIDPQEFLRSMRGRRDAAEAERLREDLAANDAIRAERGLPPLNPDPRPADPDAILARARAARDAMLGSRRDMSFEELQALSSRQYDAQQEAIAALSVEPSVRLFDRNDRAVVVGPGMGPGEEGRFRVTYFDADRQPSNHTVYETKEEALNAALREGFVSRTAAPAPRDFGFTQDNPGGSWLQNKQDRADQAMAESERGLGRRGITGSVTGTMGMRTDMFLPTDRLSGLTGLMDENRRPGDLKFDALLARVREEGFDPNQAGNKIVIAVNHRGEPFVLEGNTRIAVARELGIPNVRAEVRYWNGGEEVEGPFAPRNVARIAARGPEGFAQGGEVMMRSSMPEQLHQGIGSLSEVARGMYRGGEVQGFMFGGDVRTSMGNPLDPYRQYLQQTYADPIMERAVGSIDQFVKSVKDREQQHFGSPMGDGGVMGSPMQSPMGQVGLLSGNPMQAALQSGTFDAQVAAAATTPQGPTYAIGRGLEGGTSGYGGGVPQIAGMSSNPFGNSLALQQQLGQGRMAQNAVPSGGNALNMQMLTQQLTGQPMPSTFDANRPGASPFGMGAFDIIRMGRNAGIV